MVVERRKKDPVGTYRQSFLVVEIWSKQGLLDTACFRAKTKSGEIL